MRDYFKEIFFILGPDKKRLPGIFILFFMVSIFEVAGIGLIGPYVAIISSPESTSEYVLKLSEWIALPTEPDELLYSMGIALLVIFLFKAVSVIWINYVIASFSENQQLRLRSSLMRHYMALPYVNYLNRNSSDFIHSIQTIVNQFSAGTVDTLLRTSNDLFVALIVISFLMWANPMALIVLVILFSIFLLCYDLIFKRNVRKYGTQVNQASTDMLQAIQEGMDGLKEVRILGCEEFFQNKVDIGASSIAKNNIRSSTISSAPRYLLEFIMVFFVVLMSGMTIFFEQNIEDLLPTLAMFGVAAIRLLPAANGLSSNMMRLRYFRDGLSRLYKDLSELSFDKTLMNVDQGNDKYNAFKILKLDNINFRYPNATNYSLQKMSLEIRCGASIGLIGPSGSGKTTLVDTLLGMLEPESGDITYNDIPLSESIKMWRRHVAYLPQQIFIIDNTLRMNVALGEKANEINDERLTSALNMALLTELVDQLPKGVDTMLGENGARLSGGQRQRIALARAFYHERDVLVLDEATSALDNDTEREIVAEIQRLKGVKTMIVIAHRLTTVQHCDQIYKIENGKIVDSGTPQEMLGIN